MKVTTKRVLLSLGYRDTGIGTLWAKPFGNSLITFNWETGEICNRFLTTNREPAVYSSHTFDLSNDDLSVLITQFEAYTRTDIPAGYTRDMGFLTPLQAAEFILDECEEGEHL